MVSKSDKDKDKIKKLIKKLKGKKKKVAKKKPTQKQKQKQSVIQNVRISAPQQSQRAIGFPTQVITTPSSDTEFLRSVIQQQTQNNLTRDYQARNPQIGMRLDDQIGLSSQRAFPQTQSPQIEATIPEEQTPSMSDPNFREAMLQQQDMMMAKANANASKSKRVNVSKDVVITTALPITKKGRTEETKYKNMNLEQLATSYITGTDRQKNKALKEGLARGYTQAEIDKFSGLAKPKKGNKKIEAFFQKEQTPTKDIPVIQKDQKQDIFL